MLATIEGKVWRAWTAFIAAPTRHHCGRPASFHFIQLSEKQFETSVPAGTVDGLLEWFVALNPTEPKEVARTAIIASLSNMPKCVQLHFLLLASLTA